MIKKTAAAPALLVDLVKFAATRNANPIRTNLRLIVNLHVRKVNHVLMALALIIRATVHVRHLVLEMKLALLELVPIT